jgi:hypothetical protein
VLHNACKLLASWQDDPELRELTMAVNVSSSQFRHASFVDDVARVLAITGAPSGLLKLELTESLLVEDMETTIATMTALGGYGVGFALDDFGTGYSSLSYLKRMPLDQLKIDQSFVRDLLTDPNDAAIVDTIIALSRSLGLEVIAEGVETPHNAICWPARAAASTRATCSAAPCPRTFWRPSCTQNLFKVFLEIALECNRDEWMLRMRRMGSCPCKQPGRPIARFHSNPSGKCLAGRSAALRRLWIAGLSTAHRALHPIPARYLCDSKKKLSPGLSTMKKARCFGGHRARGSAVRVDNCWRLLIRFLAAGASHGHVAAAHTAVAAVVMAPVAALPALAAHVLTPGVEGLLLLWREGGVEGLGGFAPAVCFSGLLGAHGAHAVDALRGGELLHVGAAQAGRALAWLHGGGEGGPGRFLCGCQLELCLEGLGAFGHVGLAALLPVARLAGLLGRGRCGGWRRHCRGSWLGQHGQGEGGHHGGGGNTALEERHGVGPFQGLVRWNDRFSG